MKAALLALALLALAPLAASADGGASVDAADEGYAPALVVVASGESVTWRSVDNTHVTQETPALRATDPCFAVVTASAQSASVRFDLVDGQLVATSVDGSFPCENALVAGSAAVLAYHCTLHPLMRGAVVVLR